MGKKCCKIFVVVAKQAVESKSTREKSKLNDFEKKVLTRKGKIQQVLNEKKTKVQRKKIQIKQAKKMFCLSTVCRKRRSLQIQILFRGVTNQNVKNCG